MTNTDDIAIRRVYGDHGPGDGHRVLVDRLWPRGVAKVDAPWDEWLKEAAPSTPLRRRYHRGEESFTEFQRQYAIELDDDAHTAAVDRLLTLKRDGGLVLLTAAKDVAHSHVPILVERLSQPG